MKHKLININTKEEHLCDKVTINEFDYYVSDEELLPCIPANICMAHITKLCDKCGRYQGKKVIACNNPNIDIPKVVDEVEKLAESFVTSKVKMSSQAAGVLLGFIEGYNKSQETHPFREQDMVEFAQHSIRFKEIHKYVDVKELLQIWKEQRPKKIYYA